MNSQLASSGSAYGIRTRVFYRDNLTEISLCDKCVTMKSGPIEVVRTKGIEIPIYSAPARGRENYIVSYYANGKRKRDRAGTSIEEARAFAKSKIEELTKGTAHVGPLTPRQVAVVTDAVEILKGISIPLSQVAREYSDAYKVLGRQPLILDAAKHYAAHLEKQKNLHAPVKLPAVVDEFLKAIDSARALAQIHRGLHEPAFPRLQSVP